MAKQRRRIQKLGNEERDESARPLKGEAPAPDLGGPLVRSDNLPAWLPAILFVGLTLLLFRSFIFTDQMLVGNDTLSLGYVARAFYADALTQLGAIPRWAPLILGGTPFLEALSAGDALYLPSTILLVLLDPYRALGWKLVVHVAAAGFFMFGWIRALGGSRSAALVAGVGYMLAPFFVSLVNPGHDGKMFVTALAPLLFWVVERHFVVPRIRSFCGISLVVALIIYTTHFQMAYFLFGAVGAFAIFRTAELSLGKGKRPISSGREHPAVTRFLTFIVAAFLGVGVAAVQFFPAAKYVTEDSRRIQTTREAAGETSLEWSSSWSLHPEEAMSLVIPEFVGGNVDSTDWTRQTYWGRNAFKHNHEYIGILLLLLSLVSFVGGARSALRWFFTSLGVTVFLFTLGTHTPVWRLFYEVVPGIELFRAPSQMIFLVGFAVVTLAAFGVDRILRAREDGQHWGRVERVLWGGAGFFGLLLLLASSGTLTSVWTTVIYSDITPARQEALQVLMPFLIRGSGIAFLFSIAISLMTWVLRKGYIGPLGWLASLLIFVSVDALRIDEPYVNTMDFEQWAAPTENIQAILRREQGNPEPYRLLSFRQRGQDIFPALHGIELAAGHHPNDLSRYRDLIGMVGSSEPINLYENSNIRRLLNVKYLLWPDLEMGRSIQGPAIAQLQLQDGRRYETIFTDPGLPRARLVGSSVIKSDDEAVAYMLSEAFDPEREVVLNELAPLDLEGGPVTGEVSWIERTPNRMSLEVSTQEPALLVIADNWFPAWKAEVDGTQVNILRAYHSLRAIPVTPGEHRVILTYRSELMHRSLWISIVLFFGIAGAATFDLVRALRARRAR
ncbi:MAG TPA: hypothetical protein EYO20_10460 [Gemmatimonadetes bacterium]|jgi:hypothetical protein|nr:hypothetical protein [Gemmatimonadota bacterium]